MNIKRSIVIRVRMIFILVALAACAIPYKVAVVQLVEGEKWKAKAEQVNFQYREVPATRGNIYAADGSLLATSLPFYQVAIDPTVVDDEKFKEGIDSLATLLATFYQDKSATAYKRMIQDARSNQKRYLMVNRRQINYQDMQTLRSWPIFKEGRIEGGVIFEKIERRYQPFNSLASRTLGTLNQDGVGSGIEYSFNNQLKGQNGKALFQRLSGGVWKPLFDVDDVKPLDGYDIQTTLDVTIQDVAETALRNRLKETDAAFGSVIVMEVATGHVKAISNLQRNATGTGYVESYNYAVGDMGSVEPGSTFKLLSMLALLEENKISPNDMIETGNGVYRFYGQPMYDAKNGGYGTITIRQAFEKSSNVAISKLVDRHFGSSPSKFLAYVDKVGLAQPLNLQLIGEGKPFFKKPGTSTWYGTSLPWISIGYESKLNPIHTLTLYNAVANGGKMVKPLFVKSVSNGAQILETFEPVIIRDAIASPKTITQLQELLLGVVENGTARNIKNPNYKIAGKTGTAQKIIDGSYKEIYYTSFAGYFPADRPKYSMVVVIDSPKGVAVFGGDVSAPVFKEIADKIFAKDLDLNVVNQTKILPSAVPGSKFPYVASGKGEELQGIFEYLKLPLKSPTQEDWVVASSLAGQVQLQQTETENAVVPNVSGMSLRDALYLLENKGLKVNFNGKGKVLSQSISPGTLLTPNATIDLVLG
ncbi:MAG: transpeptidase family protein [Algoriphagus sp.]|nr:transpeptidase family protein [Algoriphagus sp.]MCE2779228.1 transpeptidase family protein [Algoriphagus sp.]